MKLIKSLTWCHRWLGVCLCFTVMSISLTGTLLIWKKEFLWLSIDDARDALNTDPQSMAKAIEKITALYQDNQVASIQTHSENLALHKVYLADGLRAWHNQQGELLDQWRDNGRFEDWLLDLHHRFLLGNEFGLNIAGFSGLLLIPLVLIGLLIWWPRRRLLRLGLLPSKLKGVSKGELRRSHSNLGFMTVIPILLICITGVILTYPDEARRWLLDPFSTNEDYLLSEGPVDSILGVENTRWQRVLERALQQHPNATIRWVSPESYFTPYRVVGLQQVDGWNRSGQTSIYVDAEQGYMDINIDALKKPKRERLFDFTYPLHTAKFDLWYRLLLSLCGLSLFTISLFGLISFFRKT